MIASMNSIPDTLTETANIDGRLDYDGWFRCTHR